MSEFLSREALLGASDLETETIDVPEWGGKVQMRALNMAQFNRIKTELRNRKAANPDALVPDFEMLLTVHSTAEPKLAEADLEALLQKSATVVQRLVEAAKKLNGMSSARAVADKKAFPQGVKESNGIKPGNAGASEPLPGDGAALQDAA